MMQRFMLTFVTWGAIYLSIYGVLPVTFHPLANQEHTIIALASASFAWWLVGRVYDEND